MQILSLKRCCGVRNGRGSTMDSSRRCVEEFQQKTEIDVRTTPKLSAFNALSAHSRRVSNVVGRFQKSAHTIESGHFLHGVVVDRRRCSPILCAERAARTNRPFPNHYQQQGHSLSASTGSTLLSTHRP